MATTKSPSSRRKSTTVARHAAGSATKSAHRRPSSKTRPAKPAARATTRVKSRGTAASATSDDNPPLSPEIRDTLSQLKKRSESLVPQLTALITGKTKSAKSAKAK